MVPENARCDLHPSGEKILHRCFQDAQSVLGAALEIDGRRFLEIFGRARDFGNLKSVVKYLCQELVVENKVVRIGIVVEAFQNFAVVGAISGMVFRQFLVHQHILRERQETVGDVFVNRHAAGERAFAQDPRADDHGIDFIGDQVTHRMDQFGRVLVIGMQHDDNVGAKLERFVVARFLIAAVTEVVVVLDDVADADFARDGDCSIRTVVVHEYDFVYDVEWDLVVRLHERFFSLVGRKHNDDFFGMDHSRDFVVKIYKKPLFPIEKRGFKIYLSELYNALTQHRIGHFYESGDVCAFHVIYITVSV